ncbi:MAG: methyltransferase [Planctomycetota bacterium]
MNRKWIGDNLFASQLNVKFGNYSLELDVPEGIWNPTPHGIHLGNMLTTMDFKAKHVLELGTGCGLHAVVIAGQGAKRLTLTEYDSDILDNARHNLEKHNVTTPVDYIDADWTQVHGTYDALVTNPPFAKSGKRYRRYFIDKLILDAHNLVRTRGWLIFVQSSMADIPRSIRLMEEHGMRVEIVGETDHLFRDYYFEDPTFMREMAAIQDAYSIRDGKHYERLIVFRAVLP